MSRLLAFIASLLLAFACGPEASNYTVEEEPGPSLDNRDAVEKASANARKSPGDAGEGLAEVAAKGDEDKDSDEEEKIDLSDDSADDILTSSSDSVAQIEAACKDTAQVKTLVQAIKFEKSETECAWNSGGNMSKQNGRIRARLEQRISLNIPDGALLCDMNLELAQTAMKYDDEILLTLNNILVMMSYDITQGAKNSDGSQIFPTGTPVVAGLSAYNWDQIKDLHYAHAYSPQSILGQGTIPLTETTGALSLTIDPAKLKLISALANISVENPSQVIENAQLAAAAQAAKNILMLTIIGDNDSSDCKYPELAGQATIKYIDM